METLRICKQCRMPLPQNAPEGLCPECLARVALVSEPAAQSDSTLTISPDAFVRVRYFGDYELQSEIARGGMGVVWKARQSSLNRTVAVKMILAGKLAGAAEVQRFRREAEAAANLQHPNIVAIHEVGEHDGQHYYSMDYVEGRDLGALVRESGPLPSARTAECVKTIAEAVHFAHQRGTLHRDLKPQNVLVDAAGVPRITDFGLAKIVERGESLTQTGAAMGSPSYMPPEQAAGRLDQVGPQSDVYALGAILYELLTGRPPFGAETPAATMRQVMESDPIRPRKIEPTVPPDLETICLKCLEKNPARRYHSARALAEDLGRFLNHEPIQSRPVSTVRKAEGWLRRHPWTLLAAASAIAMVLMGLLYWQYQRVKFLEEWPSAKYAAGQSFSRTKELASWSGIMFFVWLIAYSARLDFGKLGWGRVNLKKAIEAPLAWAPSAPVNPRFRLLSALMGVIALGLTICYLKKIIEAGVWENDQGYGRWLIAYVCFTTSLGLLFEVVRDYQKFVYGTPARMLSAGQRESLCQTILDSGPLRAIKLYRRTVPNASSGEAREYVRRLSAELLAKHPEKFSPPPKLWDLNWQAMGICFVFEFCILAGIWVIAPTAPPGAKIFAFAEGFLLATAACLSLRLRSTLMRVLIWIVALSCLPLTLQAAIRLSSQAIFFYCLGFPFGVFLVLSGFTPKRRKLSGGAASQVRSC